MPCSGRHVPPNSVLGILPRQWQVIPAPARTHRGRASPHTLSLTAGSGVQPPAPINGGGALTVTVAPGLRGSSIIRSSPILLSTVFCCHRTMSMCCWEVSRERRIAGGSPSKNPHGGRASSGRRGGTFQHRWNDRREDATYRRTGAIQPRREIGRKRGKPGGP